MAMPAFFAFLAHKIISYILMNLFFNRYLVKTFEHESYCIILEKKYTFGCCFALGIEAASFCALLKGHKRYSG